MSRETVERVYTPCSAFAPSIATCCDGSSIASLQVSKLENELLRVSAECHRVQQAAVQSKAKYQEELALYKAMLQRLRTAS